MDFPLWLSQRAIMGCVLLTVEDREAGRRAERGYAVTEHSHRSYIEAVDACLHVIGRPCPWERYDWHAGRA